MDIKHKSLFLMAMMATSFCARAQYSSTILDPSSAISPTPQFQIVHNWGNTSVAIAYCSEDSGYFRAIDYTPHLAGSTTSYNGYQIALPSYVRSVSDFCIVDNYLVFCGQKSADSCYVGCLNVNAFMQGNPVNINLHFFKPSELTGLYKVKAQRLSSNTINVYALGYYQTEGVQKYCIAEIPNILNTPPYQYRLASLPGNSFLFQYEIMDDIILTKYYTVFAGRIMGGDDVVFRKILRSSNISDTMIMHRYSLDTINEFNSAIRATSYKDDLFTIAYSHVDEDSSYTFIRTINANDMQNVNSQKYIINKKEEIYNIVYNRQLKYFTILQSYSSTSMFVPVRPLATSSYVTSFIAHPYERYISMDTIPTGLHFFSVGNHYNTWLINKAPIVSGSASECMYKSIISISVNENLTMQNVFMAFPVEMNSILNGYPGTHNPSQILIYPSCISN